jgi:uncharacterized glyoxalase superfamily protein PhnB
VNEEEPENPKHFYGVVPVLLVDDVIATVQYYRDVLGFEIDFIYGDPPSYGSVSRDEAVINFSLSQPPGRRNGVQTAGPGNGIDAYFIVGEVDELYAELADAGARTHALPASHEYGMREFKVEDCNGYVLTFAEEIEV